MSKEKSIYDWLAMCHPCPVCHSSKAINLLENMDRIQVVCIKCNFKSDLPGEDPAEAVEFWNAKVEDTVHESELWIAWETLYKIDEPLQKALDLARTNLPISSMTQQHWDSHRMYQLAGELAAIQRIIKEVTR